MKKYKPICPKSCSTIDYKGFIDWTEPNGYTYTAKSNETYFSLTMRHRFPATLTHYEEYIIMDFYGMVGVVGGILGLFVGFSFFDFINSLVDLFIHFWKKYHQREPNK